jgi:outer membrane protein TolC
MEDSMNAPRTRTAAVRSAPLPAALLALLSLSGCAGFSHDGGFDAVEDATRTHLAKEIRWPRSDAERAKSDAQVAELLSHPLSAEDAVQIALLNNHALRAAFEELGISEADLVQSGRLPNPRFDLRHASAAGQYDIEETLSFNVLSLLTMPYAHDIQKRRFAQTQNAVTLTVLQLAEATRAAFFAAVAARESVEYQGQVNTAAETGAEVARRMVVAGHWNRLDQAREQSFYIEAMQSVTHAKLAETAAQEKLLRLLGLSQAPLQLVQRLPALPPNVEALPDVEQAILQNRIDLQLMRLQIDELAHSLKLTQATRFVNVLDLGPTRVKQGSRRDPYETGFEFSLEVPIFDSGAARVRKAEAIYAQAVERFAQAAIDARSQIRESYDNYLAAFELAAQQRDQVVPLRKAVAEQNLLRYNASLISIFELLADAREQVASVDGYIQSLRNFWIAKSQLDAALLGNPIP